MFFSSFFNSNEEKRPAAQIGFNKRGNGKLS